MKNRKTTPDIMSNLMLTQSSLLSQEEENHKAVQPERNIAGSENNARNYDLFEQKHDRQASNKAIKTVFQQPVKEKTTFNLSQDLLIELENAWIQLRRKFKGEQRITKTLIVEIALKIALVDLDVRSELSNIFQELKNS